jgi:hypothetical protein
VEKCRPREVNRVRHVPRRSDAHDRAAPFRGPVGCAGWPDICYEDERDGRHGAPSFPDSAVRAPASHWATGGGAPGHLGQTAVRTRGTRRSPTSGRPSGRQCTTTNLAVNGVLTRGWLERPAGIEPALSPWKGDVPPQHFGRSLPRPASRFHSAVAPRQVGA